MNDENEKIGTLLGGIATIGCIITGVFGIISAMAGNQNSLIASALAFGLMLNAIFRK